MEKENETPAENTAPVEFQDEETAVVVETPVENLPDIEKVIDAFKNDLTKVIADNAEATKAALEEVQAKIEKSIDEKISELSAKQVELNTKFNSMNETLSVFENRMEGMESETAVRKSGNLGGSTGSTKVEKTSIWGGHFSVDSIS